MANTDRVKISADKYRWAIQRAGYAIDDYINRYPKLALSQWIEGTKQPTIKQLEDFAKSVNVPFGFLFLENTPKENIPFPVFRGDAGQHDHFDLNVYDTVNAVLQRQNWLEDYLRENDIDTCNFVAVTTIQTPIDEAVAKLRQILGLNARWAFEEINTNTAVTKLTEVLEDAGVFVAFNGIVGNNTHRVIDISQCRGFALVNKIAPYIFVNSADAPTAQLFTLIHETAHLMLGVSAGHANDDTDKISNDAMEVWCDNVAAEFLVSKTELHELWKRNNLWQNNIKNCARKFKVSELVIARRAYNLDLISQKDYRDFWTEYSHRPIPVKKNSNGGDFYRTSIKRVGKLFAIHVKNAVKTRQLSYTEAYRLTGLFGNTYNQFINNHI